MIRGRTFRIERDGVVDLAHGTGSSGVSVARIQNTGEYPVWFGKVGEGFRFSPGDPPIDGLTIGSADKLRLRAEIPDDAADGAAAELQALVGYESIFTGEEDED